MNLSSKFLKRLIFSLTSIIIYFPVFGGILGAMILAAGAVQFVVYYFWNILSFLLSFIPNSPIESVYFFVGFLRIPNELVPIIVLSGCVFILIGGSFFILGILELGFGLKNNQNLVNQGIYSIIRHPQNFGIIIFSLGLMILIPLTWVESYSLRIGDVYSWMLFTLIWLVEAKWEELRKLKEMNESYHNYQNEVPFFIPFGKRLELIVSKWIDPKWSFAKRIIFWISIYFSLLIISSLILTVDQTFHLTDLILPERGFFAHFMR